MKRTTKNALAMGSVLPMLVGGAALLWLAVRPCEPVAQAKEEPTYKMWVGEVTFGPGIPEVDVESLPRVHAKPLAHPAAKTAMACTPESPDYTCEWKALAVHVLGDSEVQMCGCSVGNHK